MTNPLIARRKGSQLLAEAVEPKTMLVAKKYIFSAMNPKAPVRSAWTLGKRKQAAMSARARYLLLQLGPSKSYVGFKLGAHHVIQNDFVRMPFC